MANATDDVRTDCTNDVRDRFGESRTSELYIHPHWLEYREVIEAAPNWFLYGLGVYISLVSVTGIVGNVAVICTFVR